MCVFTHDSVTYKPKQYSETNLENLYHQDHHPLIRTSHPDMKVQSRHHHQWYCRRFGCNFPPFHRLDTGSIDGQSYRYQTIKDILVGDYYFISSIWHLYCILIKRN